VLHGSAVAGPWVRKACQRHLRDLKRQSELGLVWDWAAAEHVVKFFETCLIHGEGEFSGEPFILLPWQQFIIGNLYGWLQRDGTRRFRTAFIIGAKGCGKLLAVDTPVPTPSGWTTMGAIEAGDVVFDEAGRQCNVLIAHDPYIPAKAYRLTFSDGSTIDACSDHLWTTWTHHERVALMRSDHPCNTEGFPDDWPAWVRVTGRAGCRGRPPIGPQVRSTEEIAATIPSVVPGGWNYSIPATRPLDLPPADLPIEPYVLGYWLANGERMSPRVCGHIEDAEPFAERVDCVSVRFTKNDIGSSFRARPIELSKARVWELCAGKQIPAIYLRGSTVQRLSLLRGLMDGDGYAGGSVRSSVEFCSTEEHLADLVMELAISLGQISVKAEGRATLNGKDYGLKFRVTWRPTINPFRMPRKRDAVTPLGAQGLRNWHRRITLAEPITPTLMRCITVDSPHGLFLAGRAMIPTHNSPLVAGLALYELLMGPRGSEVFSAASQREQASIVFKRAALMASKSPSIARRIKVGIRAISCASTMSSFRPVSREAGTLEGQNVHLGIIDEVHVHKTSDVCDVVQDGTKGRPNAQVIEITNTGSGTHNVCWDHKRYSEQILDGMMENEAWFAYMCELDEKDSWRDSKMWCKANPSLGVTVSKDYLAEQVKKAEGIPARERRVKRLNFCIWDDAGPEKAIDVEVWKACGGPVDRDDLLGRECWGGLDLSAVHDLTALVLVFPRPDDSRILDVLPYFWLPDDGLEAKERKDRAPYRLWRDQGFLETTPGPTIDDWYVAHRLEQIATDFDLVKIGYDRFLMSKLTGTLRATTDWDDAKIAELFVPHGQGFLGMADPINELDKLLRNKRLRHGMQPVLSMCASYAVCQTDPAGNRKWAKDKAEQRIDGIVALTMAIGVWSGDLGAERHVRSVYEQPGVLV